ncbi:hypothetical protein O7627_36180 [Solwaraspora sp. WMMD1047]|uniref:hypothetical protein n=1 Tax=Solwaraspora sp. WMMD1047 TaxID=3016102 RepID=UPI002417CE72|nr:hypothetical protein [Solwaraspora sp. WMMD1047]MDG4834710.1 hypothetical protein [Solwaraspora sp. WMMD1047]
MSWLGRATVDRRPADQGGHERSGAWTVDRAVRVLATGCAEAQRPVPAVGALVLGPESLSLRLTTPDETPPPGWTAERHGRGWRTTLRWVAGAAVDERLPDPFPLLVSLGVIDEGRLLLNLGQAAGIIGVQGDTELARGLVRSWSRRLTTSPWSAGTRVIRVGFAPDPDFAGVDVSRLVEVAPVLDDPAGGILLFADRPAGRDQYQVDRLLAEPVRRWTVVAVDVDAATWRFTVGVDGAVDTGLFTEPVRLRS